MTLIEQLDNELKEAFMKGPASFIVMNKITSEKLMEELLMNASVNIIPVQHMTLAKHEDLDVLISESLSNNEFRIG